MLKLLATDITDLDLMNTNGDTPLMFACAAGQLGAVRMLLKSRYTCTISNLRGALLSGILLRRMNVQARAHMPVT